MISKVKIKHFKLFEDQEFELKDRIVLAGPNNSGKSTLLQAMSTWQLALRRWLEEYAAPPESAARGRKRKDRPGVPLTRKDFTALPLREMNLLWKDRNTANKRAEIAIEGLHLGQPWGLTIQLGYQSKEQIYIYAVDMDGNPLFSIPANFPGIDIVHIPPFSGIGAEEIRYDQGYQNLLVGQGKPGDILRNLLFEVHQNEDKSLWKELADTVEELFDFKLLEPQYTPGSPFILCEYTYKKPGGKSEHLEVASAGSGFHQVLMLMGFLFARPSSIILMDEPDAHLHIILQRQIYDRLRTLTYRRSIQLIIGTHSEVFIESTAPEQVYSFFGTPHPLHLETERDQVREALKRLSTLDLLSVDHYPGILYLEDESDLKILGQFARILGHPLFKFLSDPFFHALFGNNPREGKAHFFALKALNPMIYGSMLLDGDNRNLPEHELSTENLMILRWRRYEIENYLLVPEALLKFCQQSQEPDLFTRSALDFLKREMPAAAYEDPLGDHAFLAGIPASKSLLPSLFKHLDNQITKNEYYQIASVFLSSEVHPEISEKLDEIYNWLRQGQSNR